LKSVARRDRQKYNGKHPEEAKNRANYSYVAVEFSSIFPGPADRVPGVRRRRAGWAASGGVKPVVGRFDKSGADAIALIGGPGWSTIPVAFSKKDGNFTVTNQPVVGFQNWGSWPGVKVLTGDFAGNGLTSIALTGPGGWASIPVAFPTGGGNFDITSRTVPDFPGFAAANGAQVLAGDFAGTGITALALIGGSGWRSLPVAFSRPK
jgi:hypothetical protein